MKECKYPGCYTRLNDLSKGHFCFLHHRIIEQNDIHYLNGKFYRQHYGDDGLAKNKNLLTEEHLKNMKEIEHSIEVIDKCKS